MAVVVVAVVRECLKKLEQLVTEEAVRILGVKDDLRRLQEKLKKINAVLADAERMRIQDSTVSLWLSDLKDVMYDADDIIDLCRIKGRELLPGGGGGEPRSSTSSSSSSDGLGHSGTSAASVAFPKLEFLKLRSMPNLEDWKCDAEEAGDRRIATIKLLPRLLKLQIVHCPKLRALPEGLTHAAALKTCNIVGAESLREIKNLHSLEELVVNDSPCLERISNLPALRELWIRGSCRMLKFVENLNSLQTFTLLMTDDSIECLPEWLLGLIQQQSTSGVLQTFMFYCTGVLARECSEGGQYWTLLQGIPDFALFEL